MEKVDLVLVGRVDANVRCIWAIICAVIDCRATIFE